MTLTATERGDLAQKLLPVASKLACIVHGDGDWRDIAFHTRRLDRDQLVGLAVVLAGLVDPEQRIDDALSYLTWDEHGDAAPAIANGRKTIRGMSAQLGGPETYGAAQVLESERRQLARLIHIGQGYSATETAAQIGCDPQTVRNWAAKGWAA